MKKKLFVLSDDPMGFSLIELLTVMAIITLLLGLLVPSFAAVRRFATDTSQRAGLASIGASLTAFRNDYGDYPPSAFRVPGGYCGAQKMTEALLGRDLLGFHPKSLWKPEDDVYDSTSSTNLAERKGQYIEGINAFMGQDLFTQPDSMPDAMWVQLAGSYFFCDVYKKVSVRLLDGQRVRAGTPILYYRANESSNTLSFKIAPSDRIYSHADNAAVVEAADFSEDRLLGQHPLGRPEPDNEFEYFYNYIADPRVKAAIYPYRPNSFLLVSAGFDGKYGTADDVCNFGIR